LMNFDRESKKPQLVIDCRFWKIVGRPNPGHAFSSTLFPKVRVSFFLPAPVVRADWSWSFAYPMQVSFDQVAFHTFQPHAVLCRFAQRIAVLADVASKIDQHILLSLS
jgi:hypothetical protein